MVIVGAASMAVGVSACANDSNAGDANAVNIVNDANEVDGAAQTTAADDATRCFEIEIANFQFSPAEAVVPAGTEVVWLNEDTDIHSIISTGELFASSDTFANGESYAVTLTEPRGGSRPAHSHGPPPSWCFSDSRCRCGSLDSPWR